jgi:hypothetical protein
MKLEHAAQQALEALEEVDRTGDTQLFSDYVAPKVIADLREALVDHVRTKYLTDDFINELHTGSDDPISFARAVIAADREKNK